MSTIINKINDNSLISEEDYFKTALSFCKTKGFPEMLKDIIFDNTYSEIAAHRPKSNLLIFNFDKVNELVDRWTTNILKIYHLPQESYNLYANFCYLYVLYHELRHVEQDYNRDYNENYNKTFSYLYDMSIIAGLDQGVYNKFHDLFPIEIDANNYGFFYSYLMFLKTNIKKIDQNILLLQVYNSILSQYKIDNKKIISPIERFNESIGLINLEYLSRLISDSKIDSFDKCAHGLPINKFDYYKLYVKKKRTLNRIVR